jgi:hypothetical protein
MPPVAAVADFGNAVAVVVLGLDFGRAVQDVFRVVGPAAARPNRVAVDPHMHLDARVPAVRFLDEICQRVEARLLLRRERLQWREVVRIAPLAHLHDDSVHLRRAHALQERVHLFRRVEPLVEAVYPEPAKLRLRLRKCYRHRYPCHERPSVPHWAVLYLSGALCSGRGEVHSQACTGKTTPPSRKPRGILQRFFCSLTRSHGHWESPLPLPSKALFVGAADKRAPQRFAPLWLG